MVWYGALWGLVWLMWSVRYDEGVNAGSVSEIEKIQIYFAGN